MSDPEQMAGQLTEAQRAAMPETGWLIYKAGRGYYRPNAQGYSSSPLEAGRYTRETALSYSHPNGLDGPRDGMSIIHESKLPPPVESQSPALIAALSERNALKAENERLREEVKSLRPKPTITKETHTCKYHGDNCQEHNLHCGYPKCQVLRTGKAEQ